jgi:hypothetical protein
MQTVNSMQSKQVDSKSYSWNLLSMVHACQVTWGSDVAVQK